MRICIVYNAHPTGCSFYRLEMPNAYLGDNYTEFDYVCVDNIANVKDEDLKTVDVWLFNRLWCQGTLDQIRKVYEALTAFGAKVILDLDDYWVLESGHIMYRHYLSTKLDEQIREHIRLADHVTTTTEHLAQKIRLLNKAVTILPNEPYEAYQQYLPDTNAEPEPHLFKIGWFGGAQHNTRRTSPWWSIRLDCLPTTSRWTGDTKSTLAGGTMGTPFTMTTSGCCPAVG